MSTPTLTTEKLGIIGSRQLILVQTLDIARLTAHPVRLIPETFIAVTGRGPSDSNESGKTSFLAAVALLLGDPEWRVGGSGAGAVAALLFEPVTAGVTVGLSAATEGYIVGVFADSGQVLESAHTVWLKIASGTPYVQVRHGPGIHLATGADDRERHATAARVFRSLPGDVLGGGEFAEKLYGRSPRVLAYVASRGQVRSRPSLLKLDAGTFTPEQIGDALISLSGRAALFERDEHERRDLANKQAELATHIQNDRQHTTRETEILHQVDAREALRRQTRAALSLWDGSLARAVADTYARVASAEHLLIKTASIRAEAAALVEQLTLARNGLGNAKALETVVIECEITLSEAKVAHEQAVRTDGQLAGALAGVVEDIGRTRTAADGYDLTRELSAAGAILERDRLTEAVGEMKSNLAAAKGALDDSILARQQATMGQFGESGEAIRLLADKQITATSLAAAVTLHPAHRDAWEARLAPWRHALVLDHDDLDDALLTLNRYPGTVLISAAHRELGHISATAMPTGIVAAPEATLDFLTALSRHNVASEPTIHMHEEHTGVRVIGGFPTPIVGFDDLVAHLDLQVTSAEKRYGECESALKQATALARLAGVNAERAQAAEQLAKLAARHDAIQDKVTKHRKEVLPPRTKELEDADANHQAAKLALAERRDRLNAANTQLREAETDLRDIDAELTRYRFASRPDDDVLAAWNRGLDAALRELRWPALAVHDDHDQLVDAAIPPANSIGDQEPERRTYARLHQLAHDKLVEAIAGFRVYPDAGALPPVDIADAAARYAASRESSGTSTPEQFLTTLAVLTEWLDDSAEQDSSAHEAVARAQAERAQTIEYASTKCHEQEQALRVTQGSIMQRASSALLRISTALDTLNRRARGLGAQLDCTLVPPDTPDKKWICNVTPRWRRNPSGPLLAYDNVTNTAQEKLFSIHLVLAALLAAPNPQGRILILDELADSLGAEHRREVLNAIAGVAREHGVTVLATCQDSIMSEAGPHCREVLYFDYPSKSEALNRATRMFGLDLNGERVELTADALVDGRTLF